MRGAVVVVIGINAAAPTAAPAIAGEQRLTGRSRAGAALEHPPIHDERQTRIVGHDAVIVKPMLFNQRSGFTAHSRRSFHTWALRDMLSPVKNGANWNPAMSSEGPYTYGSGLRV